MFGSVGMPELLIIFIIALMIFGPRRLPELGKAVGQTINEFKKGANNLRDSVEEEVRREEQRSQAPTIAPPPRPSRINTRNRRRRPRQLSALTPRDLDR